MARDASTDEKPRWSTTASDARPRDSGDTNSSDAMADRQSRPWQKLRGSEADDVEKKTARSGSDSDNGVGNSVAVAGRGSADDIPIEMDTVRTHATGSAPDSHAPLSGVLSAATGTGSDGAAAEAAAGVVEYKVYKRRWFGLVQLTLLNIIVSWDVSGWFLRFPFLSLSLVAWSSPSGPGPADVECRRIHPSQGAGPAMRHAQSAPAESSFLCSFMPGRRPQDCCHAVMAVWPAQLRTTQRHLQPHSSVPNPKMPIILKANGAHTRRLADQAGLNLTCKTVD